MHVSSLLLLFLFFGSSYSLSQRQETIDNPMLTNFTSPSDTSRWIIPGDLVSGGLGVATERYCYQYLGDRIFTQPLSEELVGFQRIQFLANNNYSYDNYLYGYRENDTEHIWKIDFKGCMVELGWAMVLNLTTLELSSKEVVLALVSDGMGGVGWVISNSTLYQLPSLNRPNLLRANFPVLGKQHFPFITGFFELGDSQTPYNYIYVGRSGSKLISQGEIVVFLTDDVGVELTYNRTVVLFSAPVNLHNIGGFDTSPDCKITFFEVVDDFFAFLTNDCTGGVESVDRALFNTTVFETLQTFSTDNSTSLLLTGSISEKQGFVLLRYQPPNDLNTLYSEDELPDFVLTPNPSLCGNSSCLSILTHDTSQGYAKIVVYQ